MLLNSVLLLALAAVGLVEGVPTTLDITEDTHAVANWKNSAIPTNSSRYVVRSLPDSPPIPPSWAGRISVPKAAKGNDMFFWLFETEDEAFDDHLIIWWNGGPGCSSMIGAFAENGPLSFGNTSQAERNPYSWTKLGHVLYIDQPVGTGLSTASNPTPATDNEQVTKHFYSWLKQFYTVFPHLRQKKTHLMEESYGGIYIPYFAERILKHKDEFPINLKSIAIGNGAIGNSIAMSDIVAGAYLQEMASDLQISQDIVDTFARADEICGIDTVLEKASQYPPRGHFKIPTTLLNATGFRGDEDCDTQPKDSKAVFSSIFNSTCYGRCSTYATARDHIAAIREDRCFSMYNINYDCDTPNPLEPLTVYLNRADVQRALNISPSHYYQTCNQTILDSLFELSIQPVPPTESVLPAILTTHKIPVHIYQGKLDMVINHVAVELSLQNMTWNGAQGFKRRPTIPFGNEVDIGRYGEADDFFKARAAGTWGFERGLSYHLFQDAGHGLPRDQPEEMFHYVKKMIVGGWDEAF